MRARMNMSADGYVTTPGGWPAQTADPFFVPGESHGIREFLENCEQALMGRVPSSLRSRASAGRGRTSTSSCSRRTGPRAPRTMW